VTEWRPMCQPHAPLLLSFHRSSPCPSAAPSAAARAEWWRSWGRGGGAKRSRRRCNKTTYYPPSTLSNCPRPLAPAQTTTQKAGGFDLGDTGAVGTGIGRRREEHRTRTINRGTTRVHRLRTKPFARTDDRPDNDGILSDSWCGGGQRRPPRRNCVGWVGCVGVGDSWLRNAQCTLRGTCPSPLFAPSLHAARPFCRYSCIIRLDVAPPGAARCGNLGAAGATPPTRGRGPAPHVGALTHNSFALAHTSPSPRKR